MSADGYDGPGQVLQRLLSERLDAGSRANLLRRLASMLAASARRAGAAGVASGRWLTDQMIELAPHIPVRDAATLSAHHEGLVGDLLAERLIDNAARATTAVGVASGVVSSLEFSAPPLLLSTPVQVAAETVAVVAVEMKLVAELHHVYGRQVDGTPAVQAAAYLGAWTRRRGLDPRQSPSMVSTMSAAARRELRRRLLRRAGTNATSVLPFFAGAAAGGSLNGRETRKLGDAIRADLRR